MKPYFLLFICFLIVSCKQSVYEIGTSVVGIEPTGETISLTLAGFAAPIEGRFTLGWEEQGKMEDLTDFTGMDDYFYGITKTGKLIVFTTKNFAEPKTIETNLPVKFLAGHGNVLYGINTNGDLHIAQLGGNTIAWMKISHIGNVKSFTSSGKKLYITTNKGELLEGVANGKDISWRSVAKIGSVKSLASDGNRLYALGTDSVLYQCELSYPQESWVRIGYKNNATYLIDIDQIAFSGGKLYALTFDKKLYTNKHNSEGNLSSRAISLKKGNKTAVIVGVDVCGFDLSFINDIKEEIFQKRGIPKEAIFINASHSHFTPVTQSWITWEKHNQHPDSLYLQNVVRGGIIRSIEESLDNAVKSELFFGRDTVSIGFNRSLRGEQSIYDNTVDVIQTVSLKEKEKSVIFIAGCHPVFDDPPINRFMVSANFPGYAKQMIETKSNVKNSLFLQGCAGDINPKSSFTATGKQLANSVIHILDGVLSPVKGNISFHLDSISIPVTPWSMEEIEKFKQQAQGGKDMDEENNADRKVFGGDMIARRDSRWSKLMLDQYEKDGTPATNMTIYIQTINIGDWKLVGLSREVTTEFSLAIRDLWPDQNVSVTGYTNDVSSYLSTDPHIKANDYEGYGSFFWYGQSSQFPLQTFDTVVNKIKENNR